MIAGGVSHSSLSDRADWCDPIPFCPVVAALGGWIVMPEAYRELMPEPVGDASNLISHPGIIRLEIGALRRCGS